MAVHVLDNYYLLITFLISLGIQATAFFFAYGLQIDKLTDAAGGINFFLLALITLTVGNEYHAHQVTASVLVMIWAVRLAGFLLFRILKTGTDTRFDEMRAHFFRFAGFWVFQLVWVWTVSLPVTIANSPNVTQLPPASGRASIGAAFVIGCIMWAVGFAMESIGDAQKYRYKSNKPPKDQPCDVGVWGWTRHPNYFGEITLWWGIWLICVELAWRQDTSSQGRKALYASVVGPLFITLLLFFVSGIPTAEKPPQKKFYLMSNGPDGKEPQAWSNYQRYLERTSIFWPIPPALYQRLPPALKRSILLDWPMFNFRAEKDGPKAIEEERLKKQDSHA